MPRNGVYPSPSHSSTSSKPPSIPDFCTVGESPERDCTSTESGKSWDTSPETSKSLKTTKMPVRKSPAGKKPTPTTTTPRRVGGSSSSPQASSQTKGKTETGKTTVKRKRKDYAPSKWFAATFMFEKKGLKQPLQGSLMLKASTVTLALSKLRSSVGLLWGLKTEEKSKIHVTTCVEITHLIL
jgi:hypothetical protein